MAFHFGNSIVTDGLVMYLDAASNRSYPGTGTLWSDLTVNGNDGVLNHGPIFSSTNAGNFIFDGTDDFASVNDDPTLNSNIGTVSVWFNNSGHIGYPASLVSKTEIASSRFGFNIYVANSYVPGLFDISTQIKDASADQPPVGSNSFLPLNKWYNYTLSFSSGVSYAAYMNGVLFDNGSLHTFTIASQPLRIARSVDPIWSNYSGRVSNVKLYNRVLTAQEVLQNYNALKWRYGL